MCCVDVFCRALATTGYHWLRRLLCIFGYVNSATTSATTCYHLLPFAATSWAQPCPQKSHTNQLLNTPSASPRVVPWERPPPQLRCKPPPPRRVVYPIGTARRAQHQMQPCSRKKPKTQKVITTLHYSRLCPTRHCSLALLARSQWLFRKIPGQHLLTPASPPKQQIGQQGLNLSRS